MRRQSIWDKRFPTLLGLLIIGISTFTLTYVIKSPQILRTGAVGILPVENTDVPVTVNNQQVTPAELLEEERPITSGFYTDAALPTAQVHTTPMIATPEDGDFLLDAKPLIRGKGKPFQKIEIIVESDPQTAELTVNDNGEWVYQPDSPLPPGRHTVSVRFFEGETVTQVLKNQFEVLASGNQVAELATPSPTTTITETPTPTVAVLPTVELIPNTGSVAPGIAVVSLGLALAIVGFLSLHLY